jgi:hypothetical protein
MTDLEVCMLGIYALSYRVEGGREFRRRRIV